MKKVNLRNVLKALSVILAMFFVGTQSAEAQKANPNLALSASSFVEPVGTVQGNFQTPGEAISTIEIELLSLKSQWIFANPTEQVVITRKASMLPKINDALVSGDNTQNAIQTGIDYMRSLTPAIPVADIISLKEYAIDLLDK
jgi:hypothetical protein